MQHIHLIGIGGTGLSAIAKVLKESGYQVSGSDQVIGPLAANLQKMGIQYLPDIKLKILLVQMWLCNHLLFKPITRKFRRLC